MKKLLNLFLLILYTFASVLLLDKIRTIISIKELIVLIVLIATIAILFYVLFKHEILNIITHISIFFVTMMLFSLSVKTDNIFSFVAGIVSETNIVDNYRIVVANDDYLDINDLEGKMIGYTKDTIGLETLKIDFTSKCYDSLEKMITALLDNEIDAATIIFEQFESLNDENIRIIHNFSLVEKVETVSKDVLSETTLIYISGMDNYESLNKTGRSDVNLILGVNFKTHQLLLLSIPRDYYVTLDSKNAKDKLTHAGIYGINESINTISNLLENKIDYYIKINFASLETLIDVLGGIEVVSDKDFISAGLEFKKGVNYLNGKEALTFSRERKSFIGGDRTRGENQQRVFEGIVAKITDKEILNNYMNVLNNISDSFQTNIPENEILKVIKNQLLTDPKWNIHKYSLDGSDSYEYTYSYSCCKLYVMEPDVATIYEAITLIEYLKSDGIFN